MILSAPSFSPASAVDMELLFLRVLISPLLLEAKFFWCVQHVSPTASELVLAFVTYLLWWLFFLMLILAGPDIKVNEQIEEALLPWGWRAHVKIQSSEVQCLLSGSSATGTSKHLNHFLCRDDFKWWYSPTLKVSRPKPLSLKFSAKDPIDFKGFFSLSLKLEIYIFNDTYKYRIGQKQEEEESRIPVIQKCVLDPPWLFECQGNMFYSLKSKHVQAEVLAHL